MDHFLHFEYIPSLNISMNRHKDIDGATDGLIIIDFRELETTGEKFYAECKIIQELEIPDVIGTTVQEVAYLRKELKEWIATVLK